MESIGLPAPVCYVSSLPIPFPCIGSSGNPRWRAVESTLPPGPDFIQHLISLYSIIITILSHALEVQLALVVPNKKCQVLTFQVCRAMEDLFNSNTILLNTRSRLLGVSI